MLNKEQLWAKISENYDYVLEKRRWMHCHPEVAIHEVETSKMIVAEVEKLGLPWERTATTGLIATMVCGKPGKTIALRADIDALPLPEDANNLSKPKICVSENEGCNHACGHDAHTSMLLGAMRILNEIKGDLAGTILFCFQQGEEINVGYADMIEKLSTKNVDTVWGIHVYSALESGKITVQSGARMAGQSKMQVTFKGRGGHASRPDQSISPILATADAIESLNAAWPSRITAGKTVTLGFGHIFGGAVFNIIPDEAGFEGTMRFFNLDEGKNAGNLVREIVTAVAQKHRCEVTRCDIDFMGPVVNDAKMSAMAEEGLAKVLEPGTVTKCDPWFASEDFSHYLLKWPGVFAFLGIANKEKGTGAAHHNPKFEVDEDVLGIGMASTIQYVQEFLGK